MKLAKHRAEKVVNMYSLSSSFIAVVICCRLYKISSMKCASKLILLLEICPEKLWGDKKRI